MKFLLISPKNRSVWNFRGDLIKDIKKLGYKVVVTGPNDIGLDKIQELGVEFRLLPMDKNGLNILSDLQYLARLYRLMRKEKPDAILGYTIKPLVYGAISAKLAGVKNINSMITGAGYVFTSKNLKARIIKFFVSILYKISFWCSDTVIFQNKDDLKEFSIQRKLVSQKKCKVVNGSGVNMEQFKPAPFPEKLTFLMISRIMYNKGVIEYLKAARSVKKQYPHVRFMLLGALESIQDSLPHEVLDAYIEDGSIEHFGETDDVSHYYKQCSVYILPSYREGTPRTVLEAMAMGRPIITTDTQGCRETVDEGKNGFLVHIKDSNALVENMIWFIKRPYEIEIMGKESKLFCKKKFEVKKVNTVMISHLKLI